MAPRLRSLFFVSERKSEEDEEGEAGEEGNKVVEGVGPGGNPDVFLGPPVDEAQGESHEDVGNRIEEIAGGNGMDDPEDGAAHKNRP